MKVKGFTKRLLCSIFAICMLSCILCTFASARSSAYLDGYAATVTPKSGGRLAVTVDVSGVGSMTKIGATKIYIYESNDGVDFSRAATYKYEDYPNMMGSGTIYYKDAITHYGTPGYYYFASVYCYAENSSGSDEKNYTTSIVQAIP